MLLLAITLITRLRVALLTRLGLRSIALSALLLTRLSLLSIWEAHIEKPKDHIAEFLAIVSSPLFSFRIDANDFNITALGELFSVVKSIVTPALESDGLKMGLIFISLVLPTLFINDFELDDRFITDVMNFWL